MRKNTKVSMLLMLTLTMGAASLSVGCTARMTPKGHGIPVPTTHLSSSPSRLGLHTEGSDPLIIVNESDEHYLLGQVAKLGYDSVTKCLLLFTPDPVAVVWPPGTKPVVYDGIRGVFAPGIGRILVGDEISMVGGYEFWQTRPPSFYHVDNPDTAIKCLRNTRERSVFLAGTIESIERKSR